jgi:hypothetical protein
MYKFVDLIRTLGAMFSLHNPGVNSLPQKRAKAKPKQKGPNPLRGYYSRHAHSMHEYSAEKNLAKLANGQSGFKGFRKVRQYVKAIQGTAWVSV